mmetsp:Transcript_24243/g.56244  ORF Transcript_24243/g.56244 Transcript_24243/m.56244 type:complete len:220 (+) Transcript_24243:3-662(+)
MNERSMYIHVMGDALNAIFVIVNALVVHFGEPYLGDDRFLSDPITSLIMCTVLLVQVIPLIRDSAMILMQQAPLLQGVAGVEEVKEEMLAVPGVLDVHELHLWALDQDTPLCTAHIVLQTDQVKTASTTIDRIKTMLHQRGVHSSTLQTEVVDMCAPECTHTDSDPNTPVTCERIKTLKAPAGAAAGREAVAPAANQSCSDPVCEGSATVQCIANSCCR